MLPSALELIVYLKRINEFSTISESFSWDSCSYSLSGNIKTLEPVTWFIKRRKVDKYDEFNISL